jgi:hypothetical protein
MMRKAYLEGHADGVIYQDRTADERWLDSSTYRVLTMFLR